MRPAEELEQTGHEALIGVWNGRQEGRKIADREVVEVWAGYGQRPPEVVVDIRA